VLFADVGGSFHAIQGADPEEAEGILDSVISVMTEAVHRFDGVVNSVMGDGIMAIFGAPTAHEDHAVRAACASLAMQAAVKRVTNPSWTARGITPEIRVGLNSGEVILRQIRNALTVDYRAVGSTTHLAARMEQMAARGSIFLTENVRRLGRGMLRVRPLGALGVRGLSEPVEAFELIGVATRTRFQPTIERGLSPFVGRDTAMKRLLDALGRALAGKSTAVLVSGEPGIGKSRLCHELLHSPEARGCRVLEASALSYARTTPHSLLADLLKSVFEIHDDDRRPEAETKVRTKFAALGVADDLALAAALDLLGISEASRPWKDLDPVQRLRAIEQMVRTLLTRWCSLSPCIVMLEDLHWADAQSAAFVAALLAAPPGDHTLLLGTSRSDSIVPLMVDPQLLRCPLVPLHPSDSETLMTALVGSDRSLGDLCERLVERTAGNPFFVEETVRAYVEMGLLRGVPGDYVLLEGAEDVVPATIESLVTARLGQIEGRALDVLHAAAVLGDESPLEVLRAMADTPPTGFEAAFAALTGAGILYQTGDFRAPLFRFRHALIRDVAYGNILRTRRRLLHARALETLERAHPARLGEHAERLAEHADRAEMWTKSVRYHQQACVRAANRWANAQAIAHLDRGMAALSRAEPSPERDTLAIDLRLVALAALLPMGDHERIISLLREAESYARTLGSSAYLAKIYSQLGTALWLRGRYDEAMDVAQVADSLAQELALFPLATASRFSMSMVHHAQGRLTRAREVLHRVISDLKGPVVHRRMGWAAYPSVLARAIVVSCDGLLGDFGEADRMYAEGRPMADAVDHPYSRTMLLEEYGFCQWVRGEVQSACELLELAMQICVENEVAVMRAPIAARLGMALIDAGRPQEGRCFVEEAVAHGFLETAGHYAKTYVLLSLAEAHARSGEPELAVDDARRAEQITRDAGEHAYHVCALIQLGVALASAREHGAALETTTMALREAREVQMAPFEALALQVRAVTLSGRRAYEDARRDLDAAEVLWQRLGAPARERQVTMQREGLEAADQGEGLLRYWSALTLGRKK
jgi:class 3 adenylate cyclase/tetratricopeptide (TPR) repeat protein